MIVYLGGTAFEPMVTRNGNTFVSSASILEDGHSTSLGKWGFFANEDCAIDFAIRSATAFIEGNELPVPPVRLSA
ncbi:conserved hypothetical protein [Burkholderia sp. 8Y]|uniref:hypothetical protein n=1 Tax=Burkholderia sp. 8Y TaxID=2653133 RepID=UPI0012F23D92|nr:hypothetical protein [Burkholderia sp. 8Y]VXC84409.1 conserved hypothetical protein [Burkholderia sp. 8Y]